MYRLTFVAVFAVLTASHRVGVRAHDLDGQPHHHPHDHEHEHEHEHEHDHEYYNKTCWPDESVRIKCFSELPNTGAAIKKIGMSWLMPHLQNDSYSLSGLMPYESVDSTVDTIEQDPSYFCENLDLFKKGLLCLEDFFKTNCSLHTMKMGGPRFDAAFDYFCSRVHDLDVGCLLVDERELMKCHKQIISKMVTGTLRPQTTPFDPEKHGNETGYETAVIEEATCFYSYHTYSCVKKNTESCDHTTAHVLYEYSKMLMSPDCVAKMSVWESLEASGASSATDTLSSALFILLLVWSLSL